MRRQCELTVDRREQRFACIRECDEKRIPLCVDLVAPVRAESRSQEPLVIHKDGRIPITKLLDESRRPLDVREEEGDCATGVAGTMVESSSSLLERAATSDLGSATWN